MNTSILFNDTISSVIHFTRVDFAIILALLFVSLAIGVFIAFFQNANEKSDDFLFGGFKMKCLPVALSLLASQLSPIVILTMPVEIYQYGWQYTLFLPALVLVALALCYIFLPILYQNELDNCYTYLDMRYGPIARNINIVVFTINNFLYLPMIVYIPSIALAELTNLNVHVINAIVCYTCVIYTILVSQPKPNFSLNGLSTGKLILRKAPKMSECCRVYFVVNPNTANVGIFKINIDSPSRPFLGGLKAIISIGLIHALVLVSFIVSIASLGVYYVGFDEIWSRSVVGGRIIPPDLSVNLTSRTTLWNLTVNTFVVWISHVAFSQNNIQRIVSVPSLKTSRRTVIVFFVMIAVILFINCGIGLIMYAYYYDCDPIRSHKLPNYDKLLPDFTQNIAGHINGMQGLFIASLLCAALSIVSPILHTMAGIWYKDCIRPLKWFPDNDANANLTMRIIIFAVGTYCAVSSLLVHAFQSAFQVLNAVTNMTTGAKFGVFTMGLFWPWTNIYGLLSGTAFSMCMVFALIVNAQYHIATGELYHSTMPTSINGCSDENFTMVQPSVETILYSDADEEFAIHDISFHWYTLIGVICVWLPGVSISYLTGGKDLSNFNYQLVSPWMHRWMPKKCLHTKLKQINTTYDEVEKNNLLI